MRHATITLNVTAALVAGEDRHPGVVMRLLAHQFGFRITSRDENGLWSIPQTVMFEVETDAKELPTLPSYCTTRPHR